MASGVTTGCAWPGREESVQAKPSRSNYCDIHRDCTLNHELLDPGFEYICNFTWTLFMTLFKAIQKKGKGKGKGKVIPLQVRCGPEGG